MELGFLPESKKHPSPVSEQTYHHLGEFAYYGVRPFSSLEIEVSTRCYLRCPSCPRVAFGRSWIERDMSWETFEGVAGIFDKFETIHFRGWGDPLLNLDFSRMVKLAHQSGARLVLSSNGVILPDLELLSYFSAINFRLDYGRASTYEKRNPKVKFNRAIFNISQMLKHRDALSSRPDISILFAKNKYSFNELPEYLSTAIKLHPDRVIFYHPRFHVRNIDSRAKLSSEVDQDLVRQMDDKLESMAASAGLELVNQFSAEHEDSSSRCVFDPENSIYVAWNGRVALCRHSALPVAGGNFTRYMMGKEKSLQTALFGCLLEHSLEDVLMDKKFRDIKSACLNGIRRPIDQGHGCDPTNAVNENQGKVIYLTKRRANLRSGFCSPPDSRF